MLAIGGSAALAYFYIHPDDGIITQHEQVAALCLILSIPLAILLLLFGSLFAISGGEMFLAIWRLLLAGIAVFIVTITFPLLLIIGGLYLKSKRGIPFKETWTQGPNLFKFFLLNIHPIYFAVLPELWQLESKALREHYRKKKPYRSQLDFEKLRLGDIILTGIDDWESAVPIKAYNVLTAGEAFRTWTHAAIYSGDGKIIEAQPGGRGVIETPLNDFLDTGKEILVLRHQYLFPEEASQAVDFCREIQKGHAGYDMWGVSFYALSSLEPSVLNGFLGSDYAERVFNVKQSYFCSELVAKSYETIGHRLFAQRAWRVKPLDFLFNPLLKEVDCNFTREPA